MRAYIAPKGSTDPASVTCVVQDRPAPGPGQVLVRMRAASLNARDLQIITGTYFLGPLERDTVPLSDGAGEVVEVGAGVAAFKPGDRVVATFMQATPPGPLGSPLNGVLRDYAVFAADGLVPVPDYLSFEEAACMPCAGVTAWNALMHGPKPIRPGDTVLTLGTGGVSIFGLQIARMAGARVIVTSSSDDKLARAAALGAHHGINYARRPDWDKEVLDLTGGRGVDHILETGGLGTLPRSYQAIGPQGVISLFGMQTRPEGNLSPYPLLRKSAILRGLVVGSREHLEGLFKAGAANALRPVIDRVFAFDAFAEACAYQLSGQHFGKVVITI